MGDRIDGWKAIGAYLAREVGGENPGKGYIRVAMVAPKDEMQRGLVRLRDCLYG